jgi:hypothetical protein
MAAERDNADQEHDEVIEAGLASFPASDPPSYNMPARHRFVPKEPAAPSAAELAAQRRADAESRSAELRRTEAPAPSRPRTASTASGSRRLTAWVAVISATLLLVALIFR